MKFFAAFLSISASALIRGANATPPLTPGNEFLSIDTSMINRLVEEARTNNPALKAAASRLRGALFNADGIRTWDDPVGLFGGSVYSDKGFSPSEDGNLVYGIEEKLPLWGRPKLTLRVAQSDVGVRKAEEAFEVEELRSNIAKGLLKIALSQRIIKIGEEDLRWLQSMVQATDNSYRSGQASIADTLQIQNEVATRNDTLLTERLHLADERSTLNRIVNRRLSSPWPSLQIPAVSPVIPLSTRLLDLASKNEPKLKVLDQEIKQAEASAELTHKMGLPDVSIGAETRQYSGDGGFREGMFTLRFSLPWVNGEKHHKDYQRDKERQMTTELERENQISIIQERLHHLSNGIEASRRQAILQREQIAVRAEQVLANRLVEWESGRGTLRDVLDARRVLLESQVLSARAAVEERELLAEMLLWTGLRDLETLAPLANEAPLSANHGDELPHLNR